MNRLLLAPLILVLGLPVHAGSPDFFDDQQIKDFLEKAHGREIADEEIKEYRQAECVGIEMGIQARLDINSENPTKGFDKKIIKYCKIDKAKIKELKQGNEKIKNSPSRVERYPENYVYKGKTYWASRVCEPPRRMVWTTYPSFLGIGGKVEEAGCMTPLELEAFNREMRLRRASRPVIINNPAPITQPSGGGMIIPMYQKPINCTGVNYGGAGFSATCN